MIHVKTLPKQCNQSLLATSAGSLTVGIYDKYFSLMGGGEKYIGLLAISLTKLGYDVSILTHLSFDLTTTKRLNLDLSKIKIVMTPKGSEQELSTKFQKYDIFINASHFSIIPNKSKFGIYLVYFPVTYKNKYWPFLKKIIYFILSFLLPNLQKNFNEIRGFYKEESPWRTTGAWTNGEAEIELYNQIKANIIIETAPNGPYSLEKSNIQIALNNKPLDQKKIKFHGNQIHIHQPNDVTYPLKITIKSKTFVPAKTPGFKNEDMRRLGIYITNIYDSKRRLKNIFYKIIINPLISFAVNLHDKKTALSYRKFINTYDKLIIISQYSDDWSQKIWKRRGDILYPPVDTDEFKPSARKKNVIISVGRFFIDGHNKKHIPMIQSFKKLCDSGLQNWELHLCGGIQQETKDQEYLATLKKLTKGYPVRILTNISFKDLVGEYANAKIYWHATGYGEDPKKDPDKFEHFGITTVEAMSAGAVPVIIDRAGQRETVIHGKNGFRWETLEDLQKYTAKLIQNPKMLSEMSLKAIQGSKRFDSKVFHKKIEEMFSKIEKIIPN